METQSTVLEERRAKLAQIRGELYVQDRDVTSAPSLTHVDEFQEIYGAAQKESGKPVTTDQLAASINDHKIFYGGARKAAADKKQSDLDYNSLVEQASRRGDRGSRNSSLPHHDAQAGSSASVGAHPHQDVNAAQRGSSEDLGYQSSTASPNETKKLSTISARVKMLTVEKPLDALSQSLPEAFLKAVKSDLSQSVGQAVDKQTNKTKVVYDPRIFDAAKTKESGTSKAKDPEEDDVEQSYFKKWENINASKCDSSEACKVKRSESFKHFIRDSFKASSSSITRNETFQAFDRQNIPRRKVEPRTIPEVVQVPEAGETLSPNTLKQSPVLECIDLGEIQHDPQPEPLPHRSPTLSCRTEFTEPDGRGRCRSANRSRLNNLALPGLKQRKKSLFLQPPPAVDGSTDKCKSCKHNRSFCWWGGIFLLLVDIITIILLALLYDKMKHHNPGVPLATGEGVTASYFAHPEIPILEDSGSRQPKSISPRSLDFGNKTEMEIIQQLAEKIDNLTSEVESMKHPPSFSCHRTSNLNQEGMISYDTCSISTPGMDPSSGTFSVRSAGVYQLTFTGHLVSISGEKLSVDMFVKRKGSIIPQIIARSSAKVEENTASPFVRHDDLFTTATIVVMENLNENDKVYVSMVVEGGYSSSRLESDSSRKIHFTGIKIS